MKIKKLNESMLPSQATLDDCLDDYRQNAFGFAGVEDYVDTNYPTHPQEFKATVCDYLKNHKNESLDEAWQEGDQVTIKWNEPNFKPYAYATCEYQGKTEDGKHKFKSTTYGWDFIVDLENKKIKTPHDKEYDLWDESGWTKDVVEEDIETSTEWEYTDKDGNKGRIRQLDDEGNPKSLTRDQAKEIAKFRGHEDDELNPINESKSIKEDVEVIYQKGNKKIIKDGYGYAIDDGINANRFYVTDDDKPKFDDGCNSKFWLDKVNSLIKAGKLTSRKNESKSIKESSYKKGDRVELDNGMTGTVTKDFDWKNEDQVSVEIDGTGEMRYPRSEMLKDLNESKSIQKWAIFADDRFQMHVNGTEDMAKEAIADMQKADEEDKALFAAHGLDMPVYRYELVKYVQSDNPEISGIFKVDENFKIHQSNGDSTNLSVLTDESKSIREDIGYNPEYHSYIEEVAQRIDAGEYDDTYEVCEYVAKKFNKDINTVRDDINELIKDSKSIKESVNDLMIYLFPELTDEDLEMAKGYGLKYLGKNRGADGNEDNWVLRGAESSLRMFADKYLGYELHPDYLYDEEEFAGDIINESLMGLELDKDDILDWLAEHEQAWADAERYFGDSSMEFAMTSDADSPLEEVSVKDLVEWIADHKQLYDDFHRFFYEDNLDEEFLNFDFNRNPDDDVDGIIQ